ncbi:MAG TPA: OpgC domain-containing protein [Reyranella sp.]|jgi:hypothetical protein|nr:OpgC domain-containing protein [Reyranella sp.]
MHGQAPALTIGSGRDLRLDLFRGLALWFIFLDHVPENVVSWLTVRNYGFSDATEIFVYISGYTAVIAYARMMQRNGWPRAAARIWRRVWQLYVAHILLFVVFTAQIAWVSLKSDAQSLLEEMQLLGLGQDPYRAILEAALLKFRPTNLDVLPLYIVLLAVFPLVLPLVVRWPLRVIAGSVVLYALTLHFDWNLPGYPEPKVWFFNPFAWQVVFYTGAAFAVLGPKLAWLDRWRLPISIAALLFLLFAGFIVLTWHYNSMERLLPELAARYIYPIDKTNVDILRFLHFLAIAWFVRMFVPKDAAFLHWPVLQPVRRCGEHSLQVFCLGTFLALSAEIVNTFFEDSVVSQIVVSLTGIAIMCGIAYGAHWFKAEARPEAFT